MRLKVILAADCHVDGAARKAGETVEMQEEIAADFGEVKTKTEIAPRSRKKTKK